MVDIKKNDTLKKSSIRFKWAFDIFLILKKNYKKNEIINKGY